MACQWGKEGEFSKFGHSCIVSPSGRILAGIEEGEEVVVQDLTMEGVDEWRQVATYLEDRKDHLDLDRKQLDFYSRNPEVSAAFPNPDKSVPKAAVVGFGIPQ